MANVLNLLSESTYIEKMDMQNALLKAIVQQNDGGTPEYTDIGVDSWSVVQQLVRLGIAPKVFNIGDQLVCNHATYGTLTWDVLGFDIDKPADGVNTHSMTIGLHNILPIRLAFDAAEPNNPNSGRKQYGSNNWKESGIRQWLNADGAAGTWWTAQTEYDYPPSYAASTDGFLAGLDADMLACVGAVKKITARNTVTDGGGYDETVDKFFLLSKMEIGGSRNGSIDEGVVYSLYAQNYGTGTLDTKIKYRNDEASYWWTRSPDTNTSHDLYYVAPNGSIMTGHYYGASWDDGVAPVCCIV